MNHEYGTRIVSIYYLLSYFFRIIHHKCQFPTVKHPQLSKSKLVIFAKLNVIVLNLNSILGKAFCASHILQRAGFEALDQTGKSQVIICNTCLTTNPQRLLTIFKIWMSEIVIIVMLQSFFHRMCYIMTGSFQGTQNQYILVGQDSAQYNARHQ